RVDREGGDSACAACRCLGPFAAAAGVGDVAGAGAAVDEGDAELAGKGAEVVEGRLQLGVFQPVDAVDEDQAGAAGLHAVADGAGDVGAALAAFGILGVLVADEVGEGDGPVQLAGRGQGHVDVDDRDPGAVGGQLVADDAFEGAADLPQHGRHAGLAG